MAFLDLSSKANIINPASTAKLRLFAKKTELKLKKSTALL